MITSVKNPKVQWIRLLLGRRQDREREQAYVVEGVRLVEEAAASSLSMRCALYTSDLSARGKAVITSLIQRGVDVEEVMPHVLAAVTGTESPQGLVAVMTLQSKPLPTRANFVLILDTLRDPGNVGTLLRTASAAGVQAVLVSPESVDVFSPKVVRSAMGAHFQVPIQHATWQQIQQHVRNWGVTPWLSEAGASQTIYTADFRLPIALVISSEAEGASTDARKIARYAVAIPMPGRAESLNAAVAGSILIFEVIRQRTP